MPTVPTPEKHIQSIPRTHRMLTKRAQPHFIRKLLGEIAHVDEEVHVSWTTGTAFLMLAAFAYLWVGVLRAVFTFL